jgi:hypothetical protein
LFKDKSTCRLLSLYVTQFWFCRAICRCTVTHWLWKWSDLAYCSLPETQMHPHCDVHWNVNAKFLHGLHQLMSVSKRIHGKTQHSDVKTQDDKHIVSGVYCWYRLYIKWDSSQSEQRQKGFKPTLVKVSIARDVSLGFIGGVLHV